MLEDYISPAGEKVSHCQEEGESNGAAIEPTDVSAVHVPAELQGLSQPAAFAPVEMIKSKMKSKQIIKIRKEGFQQPTGEPAVEIITGSLTYESLSNLHKDIVRQAYEAYTSIRTGATLIFFTSFLISLIFSLNSFLNSLTTAETRVCIRPLWVYLMGTGRHVDGD